MKRFFFHSTLLISAGTTLSASAAIESSTYHLGERITVKPNALVQIWTIGNVNSAPNNQNIRLRRAEIKLTGSAQNTAKYFIAVDPARLIPAPGGTPIALNQAFQDFGITTEVVPNLEISAGQMKAPTLAEGLDSSSSLILPERSILGRTLGDRREIGIKASYKSQSWNLTSMLSNGHAVFNTGTSHLKDLHTRLELNPAKDFSYGGFVTLGNSLHYSQRGRWGLNARYTVGSAVLRTEYAQAKDAAVQSHGLTAEVGYWVTPQIEPVFRYETFSPSQAATRATTLAQGETIGVNYLLPQYNTKIQLSGSALQNLSDPAGTPILGKGIHHGEFMMSLQASI